MSSNDIPLSPFAGEAPGLLPLALDVTDEAQACCLACPCPCRVPWRCAASA